MPLRVNAAKTPGGERSEEMAEIKDADIVIIGGGAIGCSIAYHLAKMGARDVVLLEKSGLTQGATWHAAGLVGQLRSSRNVTRMLQRSVDLYRKLHSETGQATDWKEVGSLRLASSEERWLEIKRAATTAKSFGLEMHLLTPRDAQDLFPIMTTEGVVGAAFIPTDGYIDPSGLTQALAKGARMDGVKILEGVRVKGITVKDRRARAVITDHGTIRSETVVNAAGMWGREIGTMAGVNVPVVAVEHQYLVTEPIPDLPKDTASMRDPDNLVYYKPEVRGLVVGGYEPTTAPFGRERIPHDFGGELLPSNWDRFQPLAELAAKRTPVLETVGVRELINGPIPGSPDGEFIMGRAPELDNFFVACGFFYGIAAAGGAGRMMAEWILAGEPSLDLWPLDIRRFGKHHIGTRYLFERGVEMYAKHYAMQWPGDEPESGRRGRRSPLYPILRGRGAVYGSKFGWERPNWFAPKGVDPIDRPSYGHPNWFEHVGEEHKAVRERVGLIDQTSFAKFEVRGWGALEYLQRLASNDLGKPPGSITYTQLCNERGGIEADVTITRLAEDHFYIITGSGFAVRDLGWISLHSPSDGSVVVSEVTSSKAVINVCGPLSRKLLEKATDNDMSNEGFPFGQCRRLWIGFAPVLALRITYVGELGWELHIPTEYVAHVYELLWEAGQEFGVANFGYRALDSLRIEKGYRYWGKDITPDYNPYEAGLGFCVALNKESFLGREALVRIKQEGPQQKLCCFTLEQPVSVFGGEAILRDGRVLGVTTSGDYGYTVAKSIVYGYVPIEEAGHDDYQVEAFGEVIAATRHDGAPYDPQRKRILG